MKPATTVAYQGRPGAYSEVAARQFLGSAALLRPCRTFADVVNAVTGDLTTYGVLPVQNTLAGVLRDSCRLLAGAPVTVLDELTLPISHTLIALAATPLSALRSVRSHPAALAQCRRFLRAHPAIAPIAAADTASAVESIVRDSTPTVAAIAGAPAAALYGARILLNGIEDCPGNCTRFLIFARTITHGAYSESPYRFR